MDERKVSVADIYEELRKIRKDTSHIDLAMEKLEKVPADGDEDICIAKINAIAKVAAEREETNRALIAMYDKMYPGCSEDAFAGDDF